VTTPVAHLRELRSELLLKLALAERCGIPTQEMIFEQRHIIDGIEAGITEQLRTTPDDLVLIWRMHSVRAALRFLDDLDTAAA
jgi:PadR family transcriptional regulator AphA